MKQTLLTAFAIAAAFTLSAQGKMGYEQKLEYIANDATMRPVNQKSPGDITTPQTNEPITKEMLNCPVGVYRTYEDFINKKAEPLEFVDIITKGFGSINEVNARFKNSAKKEVLIDCATMWGFKTKDGVLYRIGSYFFKKDLHIPFEVEYVSDYVLYHVYHNAAVCFKPFEWCSSDLKSPILESKYYFGKYTNTRHNKVVQCQDACEKKASKLGSRWIREITDCEVNCADIRFVYVPAQDANSGEYKNGGMQ